MSIKGNIDTKTIKKLKHIECDTIKYGGDREKDYILQFKEGSSSTQILADFFTHYLMVNDVYNAKAMIHSISTYNDQNTDLRVSRSLLDTDGEYHGLFEKILDTYLHYIDLKIEPEILDKLEQAGCDNDKIQKTYDKKYFPDRLIFEIKPSSGSDIMFKKFIDILYNDFAALNIYDSERITTYDDRSYPFDYDHMIKNLEGGVKQLGGIMDLAIDSLQEDKKFLEIRQLPTGVHQDAMSQDVTYELSKVFVNGNYRLEGDRHIITSPNTGHEYHNKLLTLQSCLCSLVKDSMARYDDFAQLEHISEGSENKDLTWIFAIQNVHSQDDLLTIVKQAVKNTLEEEKRQSNLGRRENNLRKVTSMVDRVAKKNQSPER